MTLEETLVIVHGRWYSTRRALCESWCTLYSSVIVGERWSENTFLNMHKSSHGDQRSSTFNLNAGELSWNVLLTLHVFSYRTQSTLPKITYVRSNPET